MCERRYTVERQYCTIYNLSQYYDRFSANKTAFLEKLELEIIFSYFNQLPKNLEMKFE